MDTLPVDRHATIKTAIEAAPRPDPSSVGRVARLKPDRECFREASYDPSPARSSEHQRSCNVIRYARSELFSAMTGLVLSQKAEWSKPVLWSTD